MLHTTRQTRVFTQMFVCTALWEGMGGVMGPARPLQPLRYLTRVKVYTVKALLMSLPRVMCACVLQVCGGADLAVQGAVLAHAAEREPGAGSAGRVQRQRVRHADTQGAWQGETPEALGFGVESSSG